MCCQQSASVRQSLELRTSALNPVCSARKSKDQNAGFGLYQRQSMNHVATVTESNCAQSHESWPQVAFARATNIRNDDALRASCSIMPTEQACEDDELRHHLLVSLQTQQTTKVGLSKYQEASKVQNHEFTFN